MNLEKILQLIASGIISHIHHYGVEPTTLYLNNADWRVLKRAIVMGGINLSWYLPPQLELFDDSIPKNTQLYGIAVETHPTDSYLCHHEQMFQGGSYDEKTTEFTLT